MEELLDKKIKIEDIIYEIRGKQVMLDSDLAKLYQCKNGTKDINKAVKRNINKFPSDIYFQLEEFERENLWFQNGTANTMSRSLPHVFTEEGVAMLSTVLHTEVAVQVSLKIIRTFVKLRKFIPVSDCVVDSKLLEHDFRIKQLEDMFSKFKTAANTLFFNGQIYDAYSKLVDIMNETHEELIIIDGYADKSVLDMIRNINCEVILICNRNCLLKRIDIDKYNSQYSNLRVVYNNSFHDRFILIDRSILYHCGTSINHAGSKTFAINKIEDNDFIDVLISKIKKLIL